MLDREYEQLLTQFSRELHRTITACYSLFQDIIQNHFCGGFLEIVMF